MSDYFNADSETPFVNTNKPRPKQNINYDTDFPIDQLMSGPVAPEEISGLHVIPPSDNSTIGKLLTKVVEYRKINSDQLGDLLNKIKLGKQISELSESINEEVELLKTKLATDLKDLGIF